MKRKRHSTDEVIRKLREAEAIEASGCLRGEVLQKLEVSEQTLLRWRKDFRGMGDGQIRRLKQFEEENRRLKKAVADLVLDKQIIEEVLKGKDRARRPGARASSVRRARWRSANVVRAGPSGSPGVRSGTSQPGRTRTGRSSRRCWGWPGSTRGTGTGGSMRC